MSWRLAILAVILSAVVGNAECLCHKKHPACGGWGFSNGRNFSFSIELVSGSCFSVQNWPYGAVLSGGINAATCDLKASLVHGFPCPACPDQFPIPSFFNFDDTTWRKYLASSCVADLVYTNFGGDNFITQASVGATCTVVPNLFGDGFNLLTLQSQAFGFFETNIWFLGTNIPSVTVSYFSSDMGWVPNDGFPLTPWSMLLFFNGHNYLFFAPSDKSATTTCAQVTAAGWVLSGAPETDCIADVDWLYANFADYANYVDTLGCGLAFQYNYQCGEWRYVGHIFKVSISIGNGSFAPISPQ